jgi:hypothetical protein
LRLKAFLDASAVRFRVAQRQTRVNSKPQHIKPAFAPETEFQVEPLTILHSEQTSEAPVSSGALDLSMESEFVSWPGRPFSALND